MKKLLLERQPFTARKVYKMEELVYCVVYETESGLEKLKLFRFKTDALAYIEELKQRIDLFNYDVVDEDYDYLCAYNSGHFNDDHHTIYLDFQILK